MGILPAVEGARPAARKKGPEFSTAIESSNLSSVREFISAGQDARLYGRRDARRYFRRPERSRAVGFSDLAPAVVHTVHGWMWWG